MKGLSLEIISKVELFNQQMYQDGIFYSRYNPISGVKDLRNKLSWCGGLSGYITSSFHHSQPYYALAFKEKLLKFSGGSEEPNDSLCCGKSGMITALFNIWQESSDVSYFEATDKLVLNILTNLKKDGFFYLNSNATIFGLFNGPPGIGHMLCYLYDPKNVKPFLKFE